MNWINNYELIIIGLLIITILFFWLGKYFQNKYYIWKGRKGLDKTEKMYGVHSRKWVNHWREYLKTEEKMNRL